MKTMTRLRGPSLTVFALAVLLGATSAVYATHTGDHAAIDVWHTGGDPTILGFDPHETVEDPLGLTAHVGAPANATSMENTCGGFCGPLYWNNITNAFKTYCVTGGTQVGGDLNRSLAPVMSPGPPAATFSPGDFWMTVNGTGSHAPYVNFKGTDGFRRYTLGGLFGLSDSISVRHNSVTGKVYISNFVSPGEIYELDPILNTAKKWVIGNLPYFLAVDPPFVYATAVAGGGFPDQIVRIDTITDAVKRWDVPGGGFQAFFSFGTPNFIAKDSEGNFWVTESATDQVARLNPLTDVICEYNKPAPPGINNPHAVASSGTGATLQAYFTEASTSGPEAPATYHISVLTEAETHDEAGEEGTVRVCAAAVVTTGSITPMSVSVAFDDFTEAPLTATIIPSVWDSPGEDPAGFDRFPVPGSSTTVCSSGTCEATAEPTGMTRVAFPQTVFGSMEGSDHVFQLVSPAIIPKPGEEDVEKVTGGGGYLTSPSTATFGFNAMKDAGGNIKCELEFRHHGTNEFVHLDTCSTLTCTDTNGDMKEDTCNFSGTGTYKLGGGSGVPAMADVEVKDFREPGKGIDEFHITYTPTVPGGSPSGGVLKMGNIQIHHPRKEGT